VTPLTEITIIGGDRLRVAGETTQIEGRILSAARGSILEFAWLIEASTGQRIGINPDQVLMLRAVDEEPGGASAGSADA
jgi:hypothetical protein